MPLPSSGPISFSQIATEFGLPYPISMSHLYGKASGIPASGMINIQHMYGKSAAASAPAPAFSVTAANYVGSISSTSWSNYTLSNVGASGTKGNVVFNGTNTFASAASLAITPSNGLSAMVFYHNTGPTTLCTFNSNLVDRSGSNLTLTATNINYASGMPLISTSNALYLANESRVSPSMLVPTSYVTAPSSFVFPSVFSVSMWTYMTAVSGTNTAHVFFCTNNGTNILTNSIGVSYYSTQLKFVAGFYGGSTICEIPYSSANTLNKWIHVCITYNAGTLQLFINGTASGTITGTLAQSGFMLGADGTNNAQAWAGRIQEFRIYPRVLSTSEIAAMAMNHTLTQSLALLLPFDGTTTDGSGSSAAISSYSNNSITTSYASYVDGYVNNKAIYFPNESSISSSSHPQSPNRISVNIASPGTGSSFSVAFWFYMTKAPLATGTTSSVLCGWGDQMATPASNPTIRYQIYTYYSSGLIKLTFMQGALFTDVANIVTNQWYHVASVWTPSGTSVGYLNGVQVNSGNSGATINVSGTGTIVFADQNSSYGQAFAGYMDDVRVYQRALLASEVVALANPANLMGGALIGINRTPSIFGNGLQLYESGVFEYSTTGVRNSVMINRTTLPSGYTCRGITRSADGLTIKTYLNGVLDGTSTITGTGLTLGNSNITIGRANFNNTNYLSATVKAVNFYNSTLSDSEMLSAYSNLNAPAITSIVAVPSNSNAMIVSYLGNYDTVNISAFKGSNLVTTVNNVSGDTYTFSNLTPAYYTFTATPVFNTVVGASNAVTQALSTTRVAYSYTGTNIDITVPAGATKALVQLWGAGGAAKGNGAIVPVRLGAGGGGGYVLAALNVTAGQQMRVIVGQGGQFSAVGGQATAAFGGGGATVSLGNDTNWRNCTGGGRTAVQLYNGSTYEDIVTAGAGGGGGGLSGTGTIIATSMNGGAGGGLVGGAGEYSLNAGGGGGGGTQTAGGTAITPSSTTGTPATAGSKYQGGTANQYSASGGGGYYGGGGGNILYNGGNPMYLGGGGGGSSFIDASKLLTVAITSNVQATGCNVAGNTNLPSSLVGTIGNGGVISTSSTANVSGVVGQNGYAQLIWINDTITPSIASINAAYVTSTSIQVSYTGTYDSVNISAYAGSNTSGTLFGTVTNVTTPSYTFTGLAAATTYTFSVTPIFDVTQGSSAVYTLTYAAFPSTVPSSTFVGCYSMRLVVSTYTGPIVRLRRSSDNVQQDFYTDYMQTYLTTGSGGTGTTYASWIGANTGYVCTWYDQGPVANHATNTTNNTTQPTLVNNTTTLNKWVLAIANANSQHLQVPSIRSSTIFCSFYNTNNSYGTIICTAYDYGQRFGGTNGVVINGDTNAGDWFYSGSGTKLSYNNGVSATSVLLNAWNRLCLSVQTPAWATTGNQSYWTKLCTDGYASNRGMNGYMSEMILHNTTVPTSEMVAYNASYQ